MAISLRDMTQAQLEQYLSSMPANQDSMMQFLAGQYGNIGPISSVPQVGSESTDQRYASQFPMPWSDLQPNSSGGYRGYVTPAFDPQEAGGRYGRYTGDYSADGTLNPASLSFQPEQRSEGGWFENHIPEMAAAATLAIGGGASGFFGGPAAGTAAGGSTSFIPSLAADGYLAGGLPAEFAGGTAAAGAAPAGAVGGGVSGGGITASGGLGAGGLSAGSGGGAALGGGSTLVAGGGGGGAAGGGLLSALGGARGLAGAAGAVAGALGSGAQTSSNSTSVPEWLQPYATDLVQRGQDYVNQGPQQYTDPRFVGPNGAQQAAWEMVNQASQNPTAQQGQAATAFGNLMSAQMPDFANGARVNNQYIGQSTPGASNQYIGQTTNSNVSALANQANPYLGQTTQQIGPLGQMNLAQTNTDVGRNALLGMNNPFLQSSIDSSVGDLTRNFNNTINPNLDRMARASGSFGNSGVEQARQEAQRTLASQIGRTTNDARMADYNLQAQLGEGDLSRRTSASLADAQRNLGASQAEQQFNIGNDFQRQALNSGYQAADLARNLGGFNQQQANQLQAGMFDTTQRANDLTRNATLTGQQNQFNANLAQTDLARNASLTGQQQQFNANQGNFDITNGLNAWNNTQNRAASSLGQWQAFAEQPYRAANALGTVGQQINAYEQRPLDFNYNEFIRMQGDQANRLGTYGSLYGQARGGNSVQSQQNGGNTAAGILGGISSGVGLYNLLTNTRY